MKRGRPPLPPALRCNGVRVVFHTTHDDRQDMTSLAAYYGLTIQEMTRRWWRIAIKKASHDRKIDFRGAAKNN